MEKHKLMGGRLLVFRRPNSRYWQCSTYLAGKERRKSTKKESLRHAEDYAEEWFLDLLGKNRAGEIKAGKTFKEAADQFLREYPVITEGQRNKQYVASHERRLRHYLNPFFGPTPLSEITAGTVQEYRMSRMQQPIKRRVAPGTGNDGGDFILKPPSSQTLHKEIVILRQVLKTAHRHNWVTMVPDLSPPYKKPEKVSHRAWFSTQEYRQLYIATRNRAEHPLKKSHKWASEQLHDYVLFMANTGLRPDEAKRLEYRDVRIVKDFDTNEIILDIDVRGKRGVGPCKSTSMAVRPFRRLRKRNNPKPTDLVFPSDHRELFNAILDEQGLKFDREGNRRTAYSLRHSYISFRLLEGADIYHVAKNCRTSVEMIEKHYAAHLKTSIDAAALNVKRPKPNWKRSAPPDRSDAIPLGESEE